MERVEDAGIGVRFLFAKSLTPGHTKTQGLSRQLSVHGGLIRPIAKRLGGRPRASFESRLGIGELRERRVP
jgi:hypothetical protein